MDSTFLKSILYFNLAFALCAQPTRGQTTRANPSFDHNHSAWAKVLKVFVVASEHTSVFNYKKLVANPIERKNFEAYVKTLAAVDESMYQGFNRPQKLAFLINAYNALTVKFIADNYPVKSIRDLGSIFSQPWSKEIFFLRGKKVSLGTIEHQMLRKEFNEPRIHFAINCASIGCPPISATPYVEQNLETQLSAATVRFMSDKTKNRYNAKENRLELSKVFDWYEGDFEKKYGSVEKFAMPFFIPKSARTPTSGPTSPSISHTRYNWDLNEVR